MRVFEWNGVIFNADNVSCISKCNEEGVKWNSEIDGFGFELVPAISISTFSDKMNFTFKSEKERDEKYNLLFNQLQRL